MDRGVWEGRERARVVDTHGGLIGRKGARSKC